MLKHVAILLAVAGFVPLSEVHQSQPPRDRASFSGRWTVIDPVSGSYLGPGFAATRIVEVDFTTAGTVTIEYVALTFTAERSIKLDSSATDNSLHVMTDPGMIGRGAPLSIVKAVSHATWRDDTLRLVTALTFPYGNSPEEAKLFGTKMRSAEVQDLLSIGSDGRLRIETHTSAGGGASRSTFARADDSDATRAAALAARRAVPETRAPERPWLGGYRFGMTRAEVRDVATCPSRDYRTIPVPPPAEINLSCRLFPFNGLEVAAIFGFEHDGLKSISLQEPVVSESTARRRTELLLAYLGREGGDLSSIELGAQPVTTSAIWDNLDHRRPEPRQPASVTVTTDRTAWPVVLSATFRKDSNVISLIILHLS